MNIDNEIDKRFADLDNKTRLNISKLCYEIVDRLMTGVAELTPKELEIMKSRGKEKIERTKLIEQSITALECGQPDLSSSLLRRAADVGGDRCEHERSVFSSCIACDELERKFGISDEEE